MRSRMPSSMPPRLRGPLGPPASHWERRPGVESDQLGMKSPPEAWATKSRFAVNLTAASLRLSGRDAKRPRTKPEDGLNSCHPYKLGQEFCHRRCFQHRLRPWPALNARNVKPSGWPPSGATEPRRISAVEPTVSKLQPFFSHDVCSWLKPRSSRYCFVP